MKNIAPTDKTDDLELSSAKVEYLDELDLLVFQLQVRGEAGGTIPQAHGELDGAPVLGYVFPTTLDPGDVWFTNADANSIIALAVVSHPDFDDTPLWDENNDGDFDNDGAVYHTHWVALAPDDRVEGGFSVEEIAEHEMSRCLPPTNPQMPMYMDSPGFSVVLQEDILRVLVPAQRVNYNTGFKFDALSGYMQVNQSIEDRPLLGVYEIYNILSGDLNMTYTIKHRSA
ncbi:MAG TPA: hypothetical protein VK112_12670 [Fodinibius sp.]|nr:hypothetical protein [Fodinibius sp.]